MIDRSWLAGSSSATAFLIFALIPTAFDAAFATTSDETGPLLSQEESIVKQPPRAPGTMSTNICDLGRLDTNTGTVVAYAKQAREGLGDRRGDRDPCSQIALSRLNKLGVDVRRLMQHAADDLTDAPQQEHIVVNGSEKSEPFILYLDVTVKPSDPSGERADILFWESISDSNRPADFEAYLERFGEDGIFAPLARGRMEDALLQQAASIERFARLDQRSLEEALLALGYDVGPLKGIFTARTREAIKAWQKDQSQQSTGYLTAGQAAQILAAAASLGGGSGKINERRSMEPIFTPVGPPASLEHERRNGAIIAAEGCHKDI